MQLPYAPTSHDVSHQAAAHIAAAMAAGQSGVELRRLRGMLGDVTDPSKLTWWDTASTGTKVAVVGGAAVAVLGIGYGLYKMSKKGGHGLGGTRHRRRRHHRRSRR